MRGHRPSRRKGRGLILGLLLIGAFLVIVLLTGPKRDEPAVSAAAPLSAGAETGVDTTPDAAMAPLESAEGAAGVVTQPNAGAAANPITPTGDLGGPAGQTPAWGRPGGASSRVAHP